MSLPGAALERAAATPALCYLPVGLENIRSYAGSWTEWGNLVKAPIER